jgi:hypothetical protein
LKSVPSFLAAGMIFLNGSSGVFPGSVSSESDESEEEDWERSSSDSRLSLELAVTSVCAVLAVDAVVSGLLFEFLPLRLPGYGCWLRW